MYYIFIFTPSAPGSYDVEKSEKSIHQTSSAYSFGIKHNEHKTENLPGNNLIIKV